MLSRTADLIVAGFQYAFCFVGLMANFLICWIIFRHKKTTFSNTFYNLVLALSVPDCVHLCTELVCALPAVFNGLDNTPKWFIYSCGYFADVSFWGIAPLMLVIAVNRYVAVCHFEAYKRFFTKRVIFALITFCGLFCFFMPSIMYACTCYYNYKYAWLFLCHGSCEQFALDFNATICNSICALVALIYALIVIQHKRVQRRVGATLGADEIRRRAKESKLMFQFGLISSVLIIYQIFFWIFLFVASNDIAEIFLNLFVNLNSCCSPFLYLTFSSEIRSRLPWKRGVIDGTVTTTNPQAISVREISRVQPMTKSK